MSSEKKFLKTVFPRLSSKSPSPKKDGALKRERERESTEKEKALRVSVNKKGKSIF
jgi:hypothetical protein